MTFKSRVAEDTEEQELIYGCLMPNGLETQIMKRRVTGPRESTYSVRVVAEDKWTTWDSERMDDLFLTLELYVGGWCPVFVGEMPYHTNWHSGYLHIWAGDDEDTAWMITDIVEDLTYATKIWFVEKRKADWLE